MLTHHFLRVCVCVGGGGGCGGGGVVGNKNGVSLRSTRATIVFACFVPGKGYEWL